MKVGDYVRTEYGIAKIKSIIPETDMTFIETDNGIGDTEEDINKISSKIIDLIEVGDYVNGNEVIGKLDYLLEFDGSGDGDYYLKEEEIKSIVTKEQFENMEYKVVE